MYLQGFIILYKTLTFIICIGVQVSLYLLHNNKLKVMKTLQIAIDTHNRMRRAYYSLTNECDAYFEGKTIEGKKLNALIEAKLYAKEKGYSYLTVVSMKIGKTDTTYNIK